MTRLIARYAASGRAQVSVFRRRRFFELKTRAGIELPTASGHPGEGQAMTVPTLTRRCRILVVLPPFAHLTGVITVDSSRIFKGSFKACLSAMVFR